MKDRGKEGRMMVKKGKRRGEAKRGGREGKGERRVIV